ncbi:MAG: potassium transporter Kup [Gemmatimonadaceae bacterium]
MSEPPAPAPRADGETKSGKTVTAAMTAESPVPMQRHHAESNPAGKRLALLTLTALGVVYGDIGTSPLYALQECFKPEYGMAPTPANVYGVLSLIVWSLISVVAIKYIVFILRADNNGEGGILALLALIFQEDKEDGMSRTRLALYIALGLIGAALLYGDGIITPAISVLGAMEGLKVGAPAFERFVVPATLVILFALFLVQKKGTARVGVVFGPVMMLWFLTLTVLGLAEIVREPEILAAVNPIYALRLFATHGVHAFILLGAVVLAVTGAEALYADMGHFGKKPIRTAWFGLVLPALLVNYFGQGALILRDPAASENPFYLLAPEWFFVPLLVLATMAAIVASQALISGAFSLTQQCVQLGYSPRVTIIHTSKTEAGQIYIPEINWLMMVGCLTVVVYFGSVSALGAAYGIAVTGTMAITTILFHEIARTRWGWSAWRAGALAGTFLIIDLAFFGANIVKIEHGGWVPLVLALALFTLMTTWKRGRVLLRNILLTRSLPIADFVASLEHGGPVRVKGTAIFMTSESEGTPVVLLHHLKHNKVLHEKVILLSIVSRRVPEVPSADRITVEPLAHGLYRVKAAYGFMETPNVEDIRARLGEAGIKTKRMDTTYFLGREQLIAIDSRGMSRWRKRIFSIMARNSRSATQYFGIPPNRVVELGTQIEF